MREKIRAKELFQNHTISASKKCWENLIGKSTRKRFLYSHEYRDQKKGGKTSETIFQKVTNSAFKNVCKKSPEKRAKKRFLFSHEIITKNAGKKALETIFSETHE